MIGKVIKKMRTDRKFTQENLSKLINIGRTTLSDYEREKTDVNFETIELIAKACRYEIIFKDTETSNHFKANELKRKDI